MGLPWPGQAIAGDIEEPQVDVILHQIDRLDEADRLILETRLRGLAETPWRREADDARAAARERGIDQTAIHEAVEDLRYGS